jgi:RNA polymerase sigma factor (sigma-70 family)
LPEILGKREGYKNDSALTEGIIAGSDDAYRYLIEKYQQVVFRTIMGFVHSETDAEDITQEVFIEVFRSVGRFRRDSGLLTWIYRIAVNKSINFQRSKSRRKIVSFFDLNAEGERVMKQEPAASADLNPDSALYREEHASEIQKAMDSLSNKQRTAFILSKYEDLSYQEIATVMNTTVSSVESLLFRARVNLQKKLYSYYKKSI